LTYFRSDSSSGEEGKVVSRVESFEKVLTTHIAAAGHRRPPPAAAGPPPPLAGKRDLMG
jgi:hypothetical protein